MDLTKNKELLNKISAIEVGNISNPEIKSSFVALLNLVEDFASGYMELRDENQKLRDEINKLKGEQGKPDFSKGKESRDISSEKERKSSKKKKKKKSKKKHKIKVDREQKCKVDRATLPEDAVFKGYQKTIVQDVIFKTDNILFKKEVYYSPSLKKTFIAKVPPGYEGEFGPGIKSHILNLSHDPKISQPALQRFLETAGIYISAGTISKFLIDDIDSFHKEKDDIVKAGLQMPYQNIDDTGSKVNGKNYYTHILCNPLYTAYFTMPRKNRLTVLNILCQGNIQFFLNEEAYDLMESLGLPDKYLHQIETFKNKSEISKKELNAFIRQISPNPKKNKRHKCIITEACAIAGMHNKDQTIKALICDDAPQFKNLFDIALCWIHEGRHYKKLNPIVPMHKEKLIKFLGKFWDFYKKLQIYKLKPSNYYATQLSNEFDVLFTTKTGYDKLDNCIYNTMEKKNSLLLVLKYPLLPLHNNIAELGARTQKRKGDVSLQTKNKKGTAAKDTFMTIIQTAIKLSVNTYDYIYDRITRKFEMQSLAELITQSSLQTSVVYNSS